MDKVIIGDCTLYHGDCDFLVEKIGNFDLLLTDPPYGIGEAAGKNKSRGKLAIAKDFGNDDWDNEPPPYESIKALRDICRLQIIFGGNYFDLPPSRCWLVWDKINGDNDFADCELAWTNLDKAVRRIRFMWNGMIRDGKEDRGDHPTQKPVHVMEWCLSQVPAALTVFDPFMGSGTTGVACANRSLTFTGIERERKYFDIACKRIEDSYRQQRLFA